MSKRVFNVAKSKYCSPADLQLINYIISPSPGVVLVSSWSSSASSSGRLVSSSGRLRVVFWSSSGGDLSSPGSD